MRGLLISAILAMAATGCMRRAPTPAGLPPGVPHVSWIIMHGDGDNPDAEFACQSTGPRECVLPASRPESRVFSDVHLYFHGAGRETTYLGSYRAEFFNAPRDSPIRTTVRGEKEIANHSVVGIVTEKPGDYRLRLAMDATPGGSTPIREDVPVQVIVRP